MNDAGSIEKVPHTVRPNLSATRLTTTGRSPSEPGRPSLNLLVARMTSCSAHPHRPSAEIGTGSGYQAAILAELAGEVWTGTSHRVSRTGSGTVSLGYKNVHVITRRILGYLDAAPTTR